MPASDAAEFLDLAERLAAAGGAVVREYFRTPMSVDAKGDSTPVTVADREAEAAMRALIERRYPDHGIIGEEHGPVRAEAEYVWVLDPIDGTKAFIAGKPLFGTLIALTRDGRPILGIIDQPVLGERWIGIDGAASRFDGRPARTRPCARLAEAYLNTTSPDLFDGADLAAFRRLAAATRPVLYGGDCYAYGLLASGHIDLVVEAGLKPYDFCALAPVIAGAGGIITDWQGRPLSLASDGRVLAAGDAAAHRAALDLLGGRTGESGPRG